MSRLQPRPAPQVGPFGGKWAWFAAYVAKQTVAAYISLDSRAVLATCRVEDDYNRCLAVALEHLPIGEDPPLHVHVSSRDRALPAVSGRSAQQEPSPDLQVGLRSDWPSEFNFRWEGKLVRAALRGSTCPPLREYVGRNGMDRYRSSGYASDCPSAGMLAYVFSGTVEKVVEGLNSLLNEAEQLAPDGEVCWRYAYYSHVCRPASSDTLKLHHLCFPVAGLPEGAAQDAGQDEPPGEHSLADQSGSVAGGTRGRATGRRRNAVAAVAGVAAAAAVGLARRVPDVPDPNRAVQEDDVLVQGRLERLGEPDASVSDPLTDQLDEPV